MRQLWQTVCEKPDYFGWFEMGVWKTRSFAPAIAACAPC